VKGYSGDDVFDEVPRDLSAYAASFVFPGDSFRMPHEVGNTTIGMLVSRPSAEELKDLCPQDA
jgi:hypothetical protein